MLIYHSANKIYVGNHAELHRYICSIHPICFCFSKENMF